MSDHHEILPRPYPASPPERPGGGGPPNRLAEVSSAPDPIGLLKALRRRWPQALGLGVVLTALAVGAALALLPASKYVAKVTFQVSPYPPKVIFTTSDNEHQDQNEFESFKRTQADMIKSRLVLETALGQPDIARLACVLRQEDPVEWLERTLQIEKAEGSEIVRLSISGDDPREAAKLVNAISEAYMKKVIGAAKDGRYRRWTMLKELWAKYHDNLKDKKKTLRELTEAAGSSDKQTLALKQQFQLERLDVVQKDLLHTHSEIQHLRLDADLLRGRQQRHERGEAPDVPESVLEAQAGQDPGLGQHASRIAELQNKLRRVSRLARIANDPAVREARLALDDAVKDMKAYRKQLLVALAERARQQPLGLGDRAAANDPALVEEKIALLKGLEKSLEEDVRRLTEATRSFGQTTTELEAAQEEIANSEDAAKKVGTEVESLNVELQAPDRVRLFEEAAVPRVKDSKRIMMVASAAAAVFLSTLLCVSWMEFRARRIDTVGEVVNGLGMRIVGTLPALPKPVRSRPLTRGPLPDRDRLWQSLLVESIDAARAALLHLARVESVRTLMITSAAGGEGKTALASQIATSLSRAGRRTLLVDCDLRSPSVHRVFDADLGPGFCEVLRGEAGIESVLQPSATPNLWLLTAGECNNQTIELLAQDGLRAVFDELRGRFDFVIVDSSPLLPVTDAVLVGQQVDAVLFSILRNVSRAPSVAEAYERLSAFGIRTLGAVVTGVEDRGAVPYGANQKYLSREPVLS